MTDAAAPRKTAGKPAPMPSPAEIALLRNTFKFAQNTAMRRDAYRRLRALGIDPMGAT